MPKWGQWLFISDEMNAFHFPFCFQYSLQCKYILKGFFFFFLKRPEETVGTGNQALLQSDQGTSICSFGELPLKLAGLSHTVWF